MVSVVTFDLFLTLVIFTSIILVLILLYFLNRCAKSYKASQHPETYLESGQDLRRKPLSQPIPSQQILQEQYSDHIQRLSSLPPSIELLPEIKTSEDRVAEEWLERGNANNRVDVSDGDLGVQKTPKTYQVLGVKRDGEFQWDWRTGRVEDTNGITETKRSRQCDLGLHKP